MPTRGHAVQAQCSACHQIGEGAVNRVGPPQLNGIFGRKAGSAEAFNYSKSMARMGADGLTWTLETLDAYIENPKALVSGTRMNYRGMADPRGARRADGLLRDWSDKPRDIPEAEPTARKTNPDLSPEILAIKGDPEYGEYLASECRPATSPMARIRASPRSPMAGGGFRRRHACLQAEAAPASGDADDGQPPERRGDRGAGRLFRHA
jgi:cytochrome c2